MFAQLAQIYVPLAVGAIYGLVKKPSDEQLSFFEKLILDLLLPLVIFTSSYIRLSAGDLSGLTLVALSALCSASALATALLLRLQREEILTAMYANAGYIPLGVATSLWGPQAAASVGFYIIGNNVFSNAAAPVLLGGKTLRDGLGKILSFPPLYGVIAGFALSVTRVQVPVPLLSVLNSLASTASPLALMAVGLEISRSLSSVRLADLKPYALRVAVAVPLTALFAAARLLREVDLRVAVIESVMPSAASCIAVARGLGFDVSKTARVVFASTLLSTLALLPIAVMIVT